MIDHTLKHDARDIFTAEIDDKIDFLKGRVKSVNALTVILNKDFETSFEPYQVRYRVEKLYVKTFGNPHEDAYNFVKMAEENVLAEGGYFKMRLIEDKLTSALYISKTMMTYSKVFLDIILVDATYKRNRFNMPIVSIVGINNFGHAIILAFAILHNETIESYDWLFGKLREAWRNLEPLNFIADEL